MIIMGDGSGLYDPHAEVQYVKEVNDNKSFPFKVTCHDKDEPEVTEILMKFVYIDPVFQDMMHDKKVLEWTKLKLGDVIQNVSNGMIRMVTGINSFNTDGHIFAGGWIADDRLKDWEKVDE